MPKVKDYRVVLGATIRKQRMRARMTLETLSEKADLHPNYMGRVERGEEYISLAALLRVAKALRVRVQRLVADL